MSNNQLNFSVEDTRNGKKTVRINNIYLHSKYDPIKEAKSFVDSHLMEGKDQNGFLILGLGLGYHIFELAVQTDKPIYVIEANMHLVNLANEICGIENLPNVKVITNVEIENLFQDHDFVNFLCDKPKTIVHPSSFKASQDFYQSFLSYRSPSTIGEDSFQELNKSLHLDVPVSEEYEIKELSYDYLTKDQLNSSEQLLLATYSLIK